MIYRDGGSACPRCGSGLVEDKQGLSCMQCGGTWAEERVLLETWTRIAPKLQLPRLTPRLDRERRLPCAVCSAPMQKVMFESIELDRCEEHGVWFDDGELERLATTAMLEAGLTKMPEREPERPRPAAHAPLPLLIEADEWPEERRHFEVMLSAQLRLAWLDARAGDVEDVRILLRRAILTMDEAINRWPDVPSLTDRRARLVAELTTWSRVGTPPR